jgi:hypothetical protein
MVSVYPYLSQDALWKRFDPSKAWDAEENRAGIREPCGCLPAGGVRGAPNLTSYVGIAGVGSDAPLLQTDHRRAGFFGYDREITFRTSRMEPM